MKCLGIELNICECTACTHTHTRLFKIYCGIWMFSLRAPIAITLFALCHTHSRQNDVDFSFRCKNKKKNTNKDQIAKWITSIASFENVFFFICMCWFYFWTIQVPFMFISVQFPIIKWQYSLYYFFSVFVLISMKH